MKVEPGEHGGELVGHVSADGHERGGAEAELTRVAGEEVEADGGKRQDEEGDEDRLEHVLVRDVRNHDAA